LVAGVGAVEQDAGAVRDLGGLPGLLALLLVTTGGFAVLERALELALWFAVGLRGSR
jgi:hypothetical protein